MKHFTSIVLLLLLTLFTTTACGSSANDDDKTDSDTPTSDSDTTDDSDIMNDPICNAPGTEPLAIAFTEVTEELGFGKDKMEITGATASSLDYDNDGFPDLLLSMGGKNRDDAAEPKGYYRLLRNINGESFEDVTFTSGLFTARSGYKGRESSYIVWGDVNNDGFTDATHIRYYDKNGEEPYDNTDVYINNGDGTFKPGPKNNFVLTYFNPIAGAAIADFDKDGNLDLFFGRHYGEYGNLSSCEQDSLYYGAGDG
ncbi:VCBS repeat-containing protein, partial [bacterium]|nr:VCBS repeat-containing protein [bacterium]